MKIYRAQKASASDMRSYHSCDYVKFLECVTPYNMSTFSKDREHYGVGGDCPVFDGLFDFCARSFSPSSSPPLQPVLRHRGQLVRRPSPRQAL